MANRPFPVEARVRSTSVNGFRTDEEGKIKQIEESWPAVGDWCYQVLLDGEDDPGPYWFNHNELELVDKPQRTALRRKVALDRIIERELDVMDKEGV